MLKHGNKTKTKRKNSLLNACAFFFFFFSFFRWSKTGRAGVPMEVMGLMLGEFVDDYTVRVVDVFAMPQSGTGVSVEAVDPVFQTKMLDMLKMTGRFAIVFYFARRSLSLFAFFFFFFL
jgi:hypothetical protein